jgi:hypothetical protein
MATPVDIDMRQRVCEVVGRRYSPPAARYLTRDALAAIDFTTFSVFPKVAGRRALCIFMTTAVGIPCTVLYERTGSMYILDSMVYENFPVNTIFDGVLTRDDIDDWIYCIVDVRRYAGQSVQHLPHKLRLVCAFLYVRSADAHGNFDMRCMWPRSIEKLHDALAEEDLHIEGFVLTDGTTLYKWNYREKVRGAMEMISVNGKWQLASGDGTIMDKRKNTIMTYSLAECVYHDGQWVILRECLDRKRAQPTDELHSVRRATEQFLGLEEIDRLVNKNSLVK